MAVHHIALLIVQHAVTHFGRNAFSGIPGLTLSQIANHCGEPEVRAGAFFPLVKNEFCFGITGKMLLDELLIRELGRK
ncbi:MAG: hypothetical protein KC588_16745 [Nitrospira sp.]|nr:hypothetical protein [Nitrospira sp.]